MKGKRITEIITKQSDISVAEAAANQDVTSMTVTAQLNKLEGTLTTTSVLRFRKATKWEA